VDSGSQRTTTDQRDLALWVFQGLKRALSSKNITKGFECTGIFPINANAIKNKVGSSKAYSTADRDTELQNSQENVCKIEQQSQLEQWDVQEIFDEVLEDLSTCRQYYVDIDEVEAEGESKHNEEDLHEEDDVNASNEDEATQRQAFKELLLLLQVKLPPFCRKQLEPKIDYV